jgi:hypothetical protein
MIGQVDISGPSPLLPNHIPVVGAEPLLDLEMIPDLGCHVAPFFNALPANHTRLSGWHENGIFGK